MSENNTNAFSHCCFAGCYFINCPTCNAVHCCNDICRSGTLIVKPQEPLSVPPTPITPLPPEPRVTGLDILRENVVTMDYWLDGAVAPEYQQNCLAQDWARVAKTGEESGEAIDALIGWTGQNPRKGTYATREDVLKELADVALTGLYAIQHFTKNGEETIRLLFERSQAHIDRMSGNPEDWRKS